MKGDGGATVDGAGTIDISAALRMACDASVARVITAGSRRQVLDLGREPRVPSAALRRALIGGCTFPGCDRPQGWCQAHHLVTWLDGGPTDLANLTLLCSHHHHLVHEGGFKLARAPDGKIRAWRPDGTPIHITRSAA